MFESSSKKGYFPINMSLVMEEEERLNTRFLKFKQSLSHDSNSVQTLFKQFTRKFFTYDWSCLIFTPSA